MTPKVIKALKESCNNLQNAMSFHTNKNSYEYKNIEEAYTQLKALLKGSL